VRPVDLRRSAPSPHKHPGTYRRGRRHGEISSLALPRASAAFMRRYFLLPAFQLRSARALSAWGPCRVRGRLQQPPARSRLTQRCRRVLAAVLSCRRLVRCTRIALSAPISLWPSLLPSGSSPLSSSGERSQRATGTSRLRPVLLRTQRGRIAGPIRQECGPLNHHTPFRSDRARGRYATPGAAQQTPCCPPGMALPLLTVRTRAAAGPLFGASRMCVGSTRRLRNRVIAKPFRVEGAG
jgi:hypothetical protein